MFDYDAERLRDVILELTRSHIDSEAFNWLEEKLGSSEAATINATFSLIPRKSGKNYISLSEEDAALLDSLKPGYSLDGWSADRLTRVCFLMHLDHSGQERYFKIIENLFLAAEMNELVALYSALPVLAFPEMWKMRCAEGIRSNIADVLEAIMYHNPYPAKYLDDKAWNQLVLKAFFTEKDINLIYGFDQRANHELALTLVDYAHERRAAGRDINPLLWRATSNFINKDILIDLEYVLGEGSLTEKKAAALTLYYSDLKDGKELLKGYPDLVQDINSGEIMWDRL